MFCPYCRKSVNTIENGYEYGAICPDCGRALSNKEWPMGWYKFLVYFSLPVGAVFSILYACSALFGLQYAAAGGSADAVYAMFPGMKAADVLYGLIGIGLGIYEFVTMAALKKFKSTGPRMIQRLYVLNIAASIIYPVLATAIIGANCFDASTIGSIVGSIVIVFINKTYFEHRREMFSHD